MEVFYKDIYQIIFKILHAKDLIPMRLVCKNFRELIDIRTKNYPFLNVLEGCEENFFKGSEIFGNLFEDPVRDLRSVLKNIENLNTINKKARLKIKNCKLGKIFLGLSFSNIAILSFFKVTSVNSISLKNLVNLVEIFVFDNEISNPSIILRNIPKNLKCLELVTPKRTIIIEELPNLTELRVLKITRKIISVNFLTVMKKLIRVSINGGEICARTLQSNTLQVLELGCCNIFDTSFLKNNKNLKSLELENCKILDDNYYENMKCSIELKKLGISNIKPYKTFYHFQYHKKLKKLNVDHMNIGNSDMQIVFQDLEELNIKYTNIVLNLEFLKNFPKLKKLYLTSDQKVRALDNYPSIFDKIETLRH